MPAILEKRVSDSPIPSPKKAKLSAVQTKINEITDVLSNETFQVPGSEMNRQMLLALTPCILETPRQGRHQYQEGLGEMLKEVFVNEGARLKERVVEPQAKLDSFGADMATRKAAVESASANVQSKEAELKEKMQILASNVGMAKAAKETFDETMSDLSNQQELKQMYEEEQNEIDVKVKNFASFKEGSCESEAPQDIKALVSLFRKIKADASLIAALPMALGRKPDERSEFDSLAVTELEKRLFSKVEDIANKFKEATTAVTEKATEKDTNEALLGAAEKRKKEGAEALLQAKAELKEFIAVLAEKNQHVTEFQIEYKAVEAEHFQKTTEVEFHEGVQAKLIELLERQTDDTEATA